MLFISSLNTILVVSLVPEHPEASLWAFTHAREHDLARHPGHVYLASVPHVTHTRDLTSFSGCSTGVVDAIMLSVCTQGVYVLFLVFCYCYNVLVHL